MPDVKVLVHNWDDTDLFTEQHISQKNVQLAPAPFWGGSNMA